MAIIGRRQVISSWKTWVGKLERYSLIRNFSRQEDAHLLVVGVKHRQSDATRGRKRDHVSVAQGVEHPNPRDKTAPRDAKI